MKTNYPHNSSCLEKNIYECDHDISDIIIKEHHLIKKHQIYCLEKLNSRKLYNMQLLLHVEKPTAQKHFEKNSINFETSLLKVAVLKFLSIKKLVRI